jgi:hypothetical protein
MDESMRDDFEERQVNLREKVVVKKRDWMGPKVRVREKVMRMPY